MYSDLKSKKYSNKKCFTTKPKTNFSINHLHKSIRYPKRHIVRNGEKINKSNTNTRFYSSPSLSSSASSSPAYRRYHPCNHGCRLG
ncbi:hypothetical protein Hanom_Chr00s005973g01731661 [Helianthus anomalus]